MVPVKAANGKPEDWDKEPACKWRGKTHTHAALVCFILNRYRRLGSVLCLCGDRDGSDLTRSLGLYSVTY